MHHIYEKKIDGWLEMKANTLEQESEAKAQIIIPRPN